VLTTGTHGHDKKNHYTHSGRLKTFVLTRGDVTLKECKEGEHRLARHGSGFDPATQGKGRERELSEPSALLRER